MVELYVEDNTNEDNDDDLSNDSKLLLNTNDPRITGMNDTDIGISEDEDEWYDP